MIYRVEMTQGPFCVVEADDARMGDVGELLLINYGHKRQNSTTVAVFKPNEWKNVMSVPLEGTMQ